VVKLLIDMVHKRKQRQAEAAKAHGEFLAAWLNRYRENNSGEVTMLRPRPRGAFTAFAMRRREDVEACLCCLVGFYVDAERTFQGFPDWWPLGKPETWKAVLARISDLHPSAKRAVRSGELRLRSSDFRLDFDAVLTRGKDDRVTFELVPANDNSRVVLALASLINSGDAGRVRRCRGCRHYFFAWPRADRQECSARCKTAYWQHTPQGRATKAAYMRDLRAKHRKLWEAKQRGRKLKRGRNVHVSLKKGE
jgi:hypothetical protein